MQPAEATFPFAPRVIGTEIFRVRFPCPRLLAALVCAAGFARAASLDARVEALFRPQLGEMMALSPDGQYVAYTTPGGGELSIVIINVDSPGPKRTVPVESHRDMAGAEDQAPAHLRFLRWASADRLIYAPIERVVPLPAVTDKDGHSVPNPDGPTILSPIMAVDADGRQRGVVVDARHFQETPANARQSLADLLMTPQELQATHQGPIHWRMPHLDLLGFLPRDRDQLIIGTRGAYSMPMQHLVDIRTGNIKEFGDEWPLPPAEPQIFDWFRFKVVGQRQSGVQPATLWQDEDLGRVQRELAGKFPRRIVEILDWTNTHARVLFRVSAGRDPGRVFVLQRAEDLVAEIFRSAPWLDAAKLHATRFFEFNAADGSRLSGYLTWPNLPRASPPPLLVVFPSGTPDQAQPAFDPEAQVFADLGFAVARLNHRRVAVGRAEEASAPRAAVDRVAVDDSVAAIEWLAAQIPDHAFDRQRVATLGRGLGGEVARRALRLQPNLFRCGIAIAASPEAPGPNIRADGATRSVLNPSEAMTNPALLLVEGGTAAARPAARAAAYRKMEEFLNRQFQGFAVNVGATKEVP